MSAIAKFPEKLPTKFPGKLPTKFSRAFPAKYVVIDKMHWPLVDLEGTVPFGHALGFYMFLKSTRDRGFFTVEFVRTDKCNYVLAALDTRMKSDPTYVAPWGADFITVTWGFKVLLRENEPTTVRVAGFGIEGVQLKMSIADSLRHTLVDHSVVVNAEPSILRPELVTAQIREQWLGGLARPCCHAMGVAAPDDAAPGDGQVELPAWDFARFLFEDPRAHLPAIFS